ncbi:hypothetical protein [Streptomyces sp. NPDC053720]|uniref:hypothetical protein n=1 Tax=Streptomyces sp. NPDC053720 TaxID=3154855 RepID=UPI00343E98A4
MEPSSPQPRAVTALALVDRSRAEVLLCDHTLFWQPPLTEVCTGQSSRSAVRDAARHWWGLGHAPVAGTVGVPWTHPPAQADHPHAVKRRLLLVLLPPGTPRPCPGPGTPGMSWWPVARLLAGEAATRPAELAAFLDGYLQGWLPDGQHGLAW